MYVKKIELENFRCFKDTRYVFTEGINVLYGYGKTTVLDAIERVVEGNCLLNNDFTCEDAGKIRLLAVMSDDSRASISKGSPESPMLFENVQDLPSSGLTAKCFRNEDYDFKSDDIPKIEAFLNLFEPCKLEMKDQLVYKTKDCVFNEEMLNSSRKKLINLFLYCASNDIILIDDIDSYLSARWQWNVLDAIKLTFSDKQVIASTSSPIIIASTHAACINLSSGNHSDCYGLSVNDAMRVLSAKRLPDKLDKKIKEFRNLLARHDMHEAKKLFKEIKRECNSFSTEVTQLDIELSLEDI